MQFGVVLHVTASYANWDTFLTIAKKAEQLGYDSVWVSDHFISPSGRPYGLEAWTVLSAIAALTQKIRLGTYVLCNQFRHPSLLAKMASTLNNISKEDSTWVLVLAGSETNTRLLVSFGISIR